MKTLTKPTHILILLIITFLAQKFLLGDWIKDAIVDTLIPTGSRALCLLGIITVKLIVVILAMLFLCKPNKMAYYLGLTQNPVEGIVFGLICIIPLALVGIIFGNVNTELTIDDALYAAFIPGIYEEIVYRGFYFGALKRFGNVKFVWAALLAALVFGSGHFYQGDGNIMTGLMAVGVTALGSLFFSWIYMQWNYNIWANASFHILLNLMWNMFIIDSENSNAIGGIILNIGRIAVVALAIIGTILYKKHKGEPLEKML